MNKMGSSQSSECSSCSITSHPANYFMFLPPKVDYSKTDISNVLYCNSKNGKKISYIKIDPTNVNQNTKYIIWSHGNAMILHSMLPTLKKLSHALRVGAVIYDYQGYGLSEGSPSEKKCYQDHESIIETLVSVHNIPKERMILIGQSIGTGVVVDYVANHEWNNPIILISPYKSIISIVAESSSCLTHSYIDLFKSLNKMPKVTCPIQIIHGTNDEIISIEHGKELAKNMINKTFEPIWLEGVGHNNILNQISVPDYKKVIDSF